MELSGKSRVRAEPPPDASRWQIERLIPGGDGLARLADGRVGFASGALPGDVIDVGSVDVRKGYVRALSWELVEPSRDRIQPPCPVAGQCGGCDWMGLERSAQVRAKGEILRDALGRIAHLRELPRTLPVVTAGAGLRYRHRVQFHIDPNGRIGFFARGTHELVEIPRCLLAHPEIDAVLGFLRELGRHTPRAFAAFEAVEVRVAPEGPSPLLVLFTRKDVAARMPKVTRGSPHRVNARDVSAFLRRLSRKYPLEVISDQGHVLRRQHADQRFALPDGTELSVPPLGFIQVNWAVNCALVDRLVRGALQRGLRSFCDVYCGVGNFSLPLARSGLRGVGIDLQGDSVAAAQRAARVQGLEHVQFVAQSAEEWTSGLARAPRGTDLVVIDPPRSGAREISSSIVTLAPRYIALCSCDPPTLARDLRVFLDCGYSVDEILGFDMFPQTHHVEALVWLRRSS